MQEQQNKTIGQQVMRGQWEGAVLPEDCCAGFLLEADLGRCGNFVHVARSKTRCVVAVMRQGMEEWRTVASFGSN